MSQVKKHQLGLYKDFVILSRIISLYSLNFIMIFKCIFFSLTLDSSVGLWVGIKFAGNLVPQTSKVRIMHSAEEDNLSPFDPELQMTNQQHF